MNPAEILITAGGTSEPIDDVRSVTNFSSGRLGHALAVHYAESGNFDVDLMCPNSTIQRFGENDGVRYTPFRSTKDLQNAITAKTSASLILHAAAVSDYAPIPYDGKISSDKSVELELRMRRLPKLLSSMREQFGERTHIAGFKLMSQVDVATLVDTAIKQMEKNDTDFCIANRLEDMRGSSRKLYVVSRVENKIVLCEGELSDVAVQIASALKFQK